MEGIQQYFIEVLKVVAFDTCCTIFILLAGAFLLLAKKVFGRIPWGVLLLAVRAFYQIIPVLWKKTLPILKALWKESLNKLIIKNGSHYIADNQKNPKKDEED